MRTADTTFAGDPLEWLDRLAQSGDQARWISPGNVMIADPLAARAVLENSNGHYVEHSDFFTTRAGIFADPVAQSAMSRSGRIFSEERIDSLALQKLAASVRSGSDWPRAGPALLWHATNTILVGDTRTPRFRRSLDDIVEARILSRPHRRRPHFRTLLRRRRFLRAFAGERENYRRAPPAVPADLLDLVFMHGGDAPSRQLAELYMGFLFSLVSSLGFALAWAVMLTLRNRAHACSPRWLISESLRLYPVAWLFERRPATAHHIAGVRVGPEDRVTVSPYIVHRHSGWWERPQEFLPERWADKPDLRAWMPFGAGAHRCVAAGMTFNILKPLLSAIVADGRARIAMRGDQVDVAAALAPPPFRLTLPGPV